MPNLETHLELAKPVAGAGTSLFAGLLLEYLGVTPPIYAAASFGAVVAVVMLGKFNPLETSWGTIPPGIVALLVSLSGGIAACYGYKLLQPALGLNLEQTPATAFLAFIIVYFSAQILGVIKSRIEGFKK